MKNQIWTRLLPCGFQATPFERSSMRAIVAKCPHLEFICANANHRSTGRPIQGRLWKPNPRCIKLARSDHQWENIGHQWPPVGKYCTAAQWVGSKCQYWWSRRRLHWPEKKSDSDPQENQQVSETQQLILLKSSKNQQRLILSSCLISSFTLLHPLLLTWIHCLRGQRCLWQASFLLMWWWRRGQMGNLEANWNWIEFRVIIADSKRSSLLVWTWFSFQEWVQVLGSAWPYLDKKGDQCKVL